MAIITKASGNIARDYMKSKNTGKEVELVERPYALTDAQKIKGIIAKFGVKAPYVTERTMTVQVRECSVDGYNGFQLIAMSYDDGQNNIKKPITEEFEMSLLKDLHDYFVTDEAKMALINEVKANGTLSNKEHWDKVNANKKEANIARLQAQEAIAKVKAESAVTVGVDAPIE